MQKFERLISIVMILLQKNIVSTTEFAKLFQVSKRTILRDMETLSLSNIPIYSLNGVHGGYGIMDEYKLDKRLLSNKDLENILAALGGLEQIFISEDVEITIKKIEAMVRSEAHKSTIKLSYYDWDGRSDVLQTLKTCQEAIVQSRLVTFDYNDRNGNVTKRIVEPYQLHFNEMSWYLRGFCVDRMAFRTFKLSRTDNLAISIKTFIPREHSINEETKASDRMQHITIKALISPSIKDHFVERYGRKSIVPYNSEWLLATIDVPQNNIGFQFLASFGTNLKIIEPQAYIEDFQQFLRKLMGAYS